MVTRDREVEMLRLVMKQAAPFTYPSLDYHGLGDHWGYWTEDELRPVIEKKEHYPVLRSEALCKALWTPRLVAVSHRPGNPIIYQKLPDDFETRWVRHHKAIQTAEDPLAYCIDHMDE